MTGLIYDVGMHLGEDSKFYLAKGFRVVAVEADPLLCEQAADRLHQFIQSGQLTIVNRAIAAHAGPITFYRSAMSGWGTVDSKWSTENAARGFGSKPVTVEATTLADLVDDFGEPWYIKIDIEGMDRTAVQSLNGTMHRPRYISMETSFARDPTLEAVSLDLEALAGLGYDRFKIVDQQAVPRQVPPNPPAVGRYVPYRFLDGESGLFGAEAPGQWLTKDQALAAFAQLMRRKWLQLRLYPRLRLYLYYCAIMRRLTGKYPNLGWYDIHARHSTVG
jgi:FkbM family methyltransferase